MSLNWDQDREMDEARIEHALKNFRGSVKAWSDEEFAKPREVRRSRWTAMWMVITRPAVGGAMAAVLAAASIGVPVAVVQHNQQVVAEQRQEAANRQKAIDAQHAQEQAAQAMNDTDLMTEVDGDIAQEAPDAMQPLASLMSDSGSAPVEK
ncbi:hypothetical protein ACFPT7_20560 [Acidicapsa dinghuensis]|uniref:Uncharacterized protein n=1 Tax=Acidicapsa dinghuensis TaxID=2218256 RepID=A0ABW1EMT4_9BACT|nr:hypothetical protein [Acidicapsa dinghuensis]